MMLDPRSGSDVTAHFWAETAAMKHIEQAAMARLVSPLQLLGHVLTRIAAAVPPQVILPALVGAGGSPLSQLSLILGESSSGKSAPYELARQLLPYERCPIDLELALSTGEGAIEAYFDRRYQGRRVVKVQNARTGLIVSDEASSVQSERARNSSKLASVLNSMWSGSQVGQDNATAENRRRLLQRAYGASFLVNAQMTVAPELTQDTQTGLAQRGVYYAPLGEVWSERPDPPGPLPFLLEGFTIYQASIDEPPLVDSESPNIVGWPALDRHEIALAPEVRADIVVRRMLQMAQRHQQPGLRGLPSDSYEQEAYYRLAETWGEWPEVLDHGGHTPLLLLRLAALFALLDAGGQLDEIEVGWGDYERAQWLLTASHLGLGMRKVALAEEAAEKEEATTRAHVSRSVAAQQANAEAEEERAERLTIVALGQLRRHIERNGAQPAGHVGGAVESRLRRELGGRAAVLEEAVRRGALVERDGEYHLGPDDA